MNATSDQVRINVWLPRELFLAFRTIHPSQGSITAFVRGAIEHHVKQARQKAQQIEETTQ